MKRVFTAALVASAFAVGLAARTPPQYPPASQPEKKAPAAKHSSTAGRSVTLTGCLREGATPGTFALSNVQWDRGGSRTSGTSGRAPKGGAAGSDTVQLTPSANVDLKPHVGHKIEVTGTTTSAAGTTGKTPGDAKSPRMTPPGSENPTTASQPESNPSTQASNNRRAKLSRTGKGATTANTTGGARTVTVTSIKMISETCGN